MYWKSNILFMSEAYCSEVPDCCDMRGMLSFYVLLVLSKKPMNGQEIVEELGKRRGPKPTSKDGTNN